MLYLIEALRYDVLHLFSPGVVHVPGVRLVVPQRKLGLTGSALETEITEMLIHHFQSTLNLTNFLYGEEKTVWCLEVSEESLEDGVGAEPGAK